MGSDYREQAYSYLIKLSEQKGYVLFDDIMSSADRWSLSIEDVDWLSNTIMMRGIIVYDTAPSNIQDSDEYDDYAQTDYNETFKRVIEIDPSLKDFIYKIKNIKPPQMREMAQLKYQLKEGNAFARQRVIEMHLRIAVRVALQRVKEYDCDMADTLQDACVGLIYAADKYDPDSNGSFSSYASLWILQNISRTQVSQRALIYYPFHKKESYFSIYPLLKSLGYDYNELLTSEEVLKLVQKRLNCGVEQAKDAIYQCIPLESIDTAYKTFIKSNYYSKTNNYKNRCFCIEDFSDRVIEKCVEDEFQEIIKMLKPREQFVIKERFGFEDGDEKTLETVGKMLGITRERVRQIESRALKRLSAICKERNFEIY
ncbi:sigma-70 family RNA polymerase sigma factor [Catenisphaera adipataccumulans]|uniref:RNA polymerase primary sigma factor n=1 Tax=Catenisphaera adipataccumulans TaxID=700500 RepID=A0A7W8CYD6_9FIRM|nr:sigma-70 family RNA polymerase sigma factor [Catenisphaera adipataccumulans]MBB5182689.1 RNA polymerase primary sigma factor [Catenisphaera adipataccumulans]